MLSYVELLSVLNRFAPVRELTTLFTVFLIGTLLNVIVLSHRRSPLLFKMWLRKLTAWEVIRSMFLGFCSVLLFIAVLWV